MAKRKEKETMCRYTFLATPLQKRGRATKRERTEKNEKNKGRRGRGG